MIVQRGIPVDIAVSGSVHGIDPYEAEITGIFQRSDGKKYIIPGFYDGDYVWKVRFSDEEDGSWYYQIVSNVVCFTDQTEGDIEICGIREGITRQLSVDGTHFITKDGKGLFLLGFECDFLFSMVASPDGHQKLEKLIANIKANGFNQVQINTYAYDYSLRKGRTRPNDYGPAYIELWNYQNGKRTYNPDFFCNFDYMIQRLHESGIYAHVYLRVYNKFVEWPENDSLDDLSFYRQFVARYQAYPNIIWNFSKEGYFEGDKEYLYRIALKVREWDTYRHLCTIHDDLEYAMNPKFAHTIDFLTLQQHDQWAYALAYYRVVTGKPVVGGETGVESPKVERLRRYPAERVCEIAYETVMSGCYYQYYWAYTSWDVIEYDACPKGYEYIRKMKEFFDDFDLTKFKPRPEICVWSGQCLDDGESTLLIYVEPSKHMPGFVNREDHSLINIDSYGSIDSVEVFGVYTARREKASGERIHPHHSEGERGFTKADDSRVQVLHSYSDEPTMFIVHYHKYS